MNKSTEVIKSPEVKASDLTIKGVFQSFYIIPEYQREYVWCTENVELLLSDTFDTLIESSGDEKDEYFIGSIVVVKDKKSNFLVIDGQQRLITIFLIFCAIRDYFKKLGKERPISMIEKLLFEDRPDDTGLEKINTFRIKVNFDETQKVLEAIGKGESLKESIKKIEPLSESEEKIINAYETALDFINEKNDINLIGRYWKYLSEKVKLIRINTDNTQNAVKVFATINDRGLALGPVNLIRNLIFSNAQDGDFEKIKDIWKKFSEILWKSKEAPLRFMRYYVLSNYNITPKDIPRRDSVYSWFNNHSELIGLKNNPISFAEKLLEQAHFWDLYVNSKSNDGSENEFLENVKIMGNNTFRHHFILLLAARKLEKNLFEKLTQSIENLIFVYEITGIRSNTREKEFISIGNSLRKVTNSESFFKFLDEGIARRINENKLSFENKFKELRYMETPIKQAYKMKYILSKLSQHLDDCAGKGKSKISDYFSKYSIEHILPSSVAKGQNPQWKFDKKEQINDYVNHIGNLTLLETNLNSSASDKLFEKKQTEYYSESASFLTRLLGGKKTIGENTKWNKTFKRYYFDISNWDSVTIKKRAEKISRLASKVWCEI